MIRKNLLTLQAISQIKVHKVSAFTNRRVGRGLKITRWIWCNWTLYLYASDHPERHHAWRSVRCFINTSIWVPCKNSTMKTQRVAKRRTIICMKLNRINFSTKDPPLTAQADKKDTTFSLGETLTKDITFWFGSHYARCITSHTSSFPDPTKPDTTNMVLQKLVWVHQRLLEEPARWG